MTQATCVPSTNRRALLGGIGLGGVAAATVVASAPLARPEASPVGDRHVEWLRDYFEARWRLDHSDALEGSEEHDRLDAEYWRLDQLVRYTPPLTLEEAMAQLCYVADLGLTCELQEVELRRCLRSSLPHLGVHTWRPS